MPQVVVDDVIREYEHVAHRVAQREERRKRLKGARVDPDQVLSDSLRGLWSGAKHFKAERGIPIEVWLAWCCRRAIRTRYRYVRKVKREAAALGEDFRGQALVEARDDSYEREVRQWYRMVIDGAMKHLSGRHLEIFLMRYRDERTLEEIAQVYGFTRERARQVSEDACEQLRTALSYDREYGDINRAFRNARPQIVYQTPRFIKDPYSAGRWIDTRPILAERTSLQATRWSGMFSPRTPRSLNEQEEPAARVDPEAAVRIARRSRAYQRSAD